MNINGPGVLPVQKVPLNKKGKSWRESSVNAIIGKEGTGRIGRYTRKEHMAIDYELYNGNFDKKDLKYITDPFDVGDSFPASPQEFNIIRPKIDLLVGEESKRPENFLVIQTNDNAVGVMQEQKKSMLMNYMSDMIGMGDEENPAMPPQKIEEYMRKSYKTVAETQASQAIGYLREKLNLPNEFLRGWKDGLIAGEEIYYVGISNGEPVLGRQNPLDCDYDNNPNLECIEDGDWFVKSTIMSPSEIYDVYYDKLKESDLDQLLLMSKGSGGTKSQGGDNYKPIIYKENVTENFKSSMSHTEDKLHIWHVVWRSWQKLGFISHTDPETGETIEDTVDENYKPDKGEKVDWKWVGQIWEGYRVGNDMYFGIEPVDYIDAPLDSPERMKLPYSGVIYSNTNSRNKSLVSVMKPLQYMYIVVWYRLEHMLARDKGRILTMDVTQIPKSMGIDLPQWMHYLSSLGVNLINPYDEGWDIAGREGGKPSQYNQISSQDLSMLNVIDGYIGILAKIEDMIGELSGVSKQRQGAIEQRELVGNVERAVIQSSHITEPLFWKHNLAKKNAIKMLLNTAKHAWKNSDGKKLHFIFDDMSRVFMDISEDFLYSDLDIFLSDSTKEDQNLQALKSLLQPAMQAGAGLFDVAEILTSESMGGIKDKLKEMEEKRMQQAQQMQQAEQQAEMQKAQAEMELKSEENRIKEEDSIRKADTSIQVALIKAQESAENIEVPEDDSLEREKVGIQKDKERHEYEIKRKQAEEAARKNRVAEKQKAEEINIKRKVANKPAPKSK